MRSFLGDSGSPVFYITDSTSTPNKVMLLGLVWGASNDSAYFSTMGDVWADLGALYPCVGDGYGCWHITELSAGINGPGQIPYYETCAWTASVSGGIPPYSYQWSGVLTGGGEIIYGGDLSGLLYLNVSSSDNQEADGGSLYISTSEETSSC